MNKLHIHHQRIQTLTQRLWVLQSWELTYSQNGWPSDCFYLRKSFQNMLVLTPQIANEGSQHWGDHKAHHRGYYSGLWILSHRRTEVLTKAFAIKKGDKWEVRCTCGKYFLLPPNWVWTNGGNSLEVSIKNASQGITT
jgi:hypothetical protein